MPRDRIITYIIFLMFLVGNIAFWMYSKNLKVSWLNIPPAPTKAEANLSFLGDDEMAYRSYAVMLQNIGSLNGDIKSLKEYDYKRLQEWLFLEYALNSHSDNVPMLAAYYFGAVEDPEKLGYILDYLKIVGENPEGEKWRWLGHAVFLAKHKLNDNDKALELAYILADNKSPDLADWARQMPVFVLHDKGDSDLAYEIMLNLLITNADKLDPAEMFYMKDYICNTLVPSQKKPNPPNFCDEI